MTKSIVQAEPAQKSRNARRPGLIVTIDGPAGAGKSTVARLLATRLKYLYLDTGALYRAVAWKVRAAGISPTDSRAVADLLPSTRIAMEQNPDRPLMYVDLRDVTEEIRTPEISRLASLISAIPAVREWLLPIQRQIGESGGVVAEGRDLGTRVFPKADVKFFLEADTEVRAGRRHREMTASGQAAPLEDTRQAIMSRDRQDRTRELAPLVPAPDSTVIDTSTLEVEQVVDRMLAIVATKL
ncbi:MAG TPA: (d)CMP kinase [Nitrospiraceae bacterium]|nr:(d)CMP kinase [Nitrospiraceae bacterium]